MTFSDACTTLRNRPRYSLFCLLRATRGCVATARASPDRRKSTGALTNKHELLLQQATEHRFQLPVQPGRNTQQHYWTGSRDPQRACSWAARGHWCMRVSQDTDQRNGGVLSRVPAKPRLMPSRAGAFEADLSSESTSISRPVTRHQTMQFSQDQHHAQAVLGVDPVGR